MNHKKNILELLADAENKARNRLPRALIIQPGAIGDCILTLPLAKTLKNSLNIATIEMFGKSPYIDYLPGRSDVDVIRNIDSVELHRLFVDPDQLDLEDGDVLIHTFSGYQAIITFLGQPKSNFEKNLIFTANCSNAVDVSAFPLKPEHDFNCHITNLYNQKLEQLYHIPLPDVDTSKQYLKPLDSDIKLGRKTLESLNVKTSKPLVVIHPGSGGIEKCWHCDNFYSLAEDLIEKNYEPLFILGPAEMERFKSATIDRFNALASVAAGLSLTETFQIIANAKCFIGNDSGITHIAAASEIPTIACFGTTNENIYYPLGPNVKVIKFDPQDFASASVEAVNKVAAQALKLLQNPTK